jgi:hypothetical protein
MDSTEFTARVTSHIPDKGQVVLNAIHPFQAVR